MKVCKVLMFCFFVSMFYFLSCAEEEVCQENEQRDCITNCGTTGKQVCLNGAWQACQPPVEDCNNKDDNCDGNIDENLQKLCETVCGKGTEKCINGLWSECDAPKPQAEVCNNKDDNCNGKMDEGDDGQPLKKPCSNECGPGFEYCYYGTWANCDAPKPELEKCDNKDNDCDKQVDEDLVQECSNACGEKGIEKCKNGQWVDCTAPQVPQEVCNNKKDDDCDGQIDEAGCVKCQCTPGDKKACGTEEGECTPGIQECSQDCQSWGECGGPTYKGPQPEQCDKLDNDCDGIIDNIIKDCETACGKGKQECKNGTWTKCDAPEPTEEICDGKDNDCNKKIDDGLKPDKWEINEDCNTARKIDKIGENAEPIVINGSIYPQGDKDWYEFETKEIGDITPICYEGDWWNPLHPKYDGCYIVIVTLEQPDSFTDYDLCVYGGDCKGSLTNGKVCKPKGAGEKEEVIIGWKGEWGGSDNIKFYVNIYPKDSDKFSCKTYSFKYEFYNDTEGMKKVKKEDGKEYCLCPWEPGYPK